MSWRSAGRTCVRIHPRTRSTVLRYGEAPARSRSTNDGWHTDWYPTAQGFEPVNTRNASTSQQKHRPERHRPDEVPYPLRRIELHRTATVQALVHKTRIAEHGSSKPRAAHAFAPEITHNGLAQRIVERNVEQALQRGIDGGVLRPHDAEH